MEEKNGSQAGKPQKSNHRDTEARRRFEELDEQRKKRHSQEAKVRTMSRASFFDSAIARQPLRRTVRLESDAVYCSEV